MSQPKEPPRPVNWGCRMCASAAAYGPCTCAPLHITQSYRQLYEANREMREALEAIIYASDQCQGHRLCGHDMEPWKKARALLTALDA